MRQRAGRPRNDGLSCSHVELLLLPLMPELPLREAYAVEPIATMVSDYPDKFGVPRQPGLVPAARGVLSLLAPFDDPLAVDGLDAYSHIWLSFVFDRSPVAWRARVRPPRLGGNQRVGVFATRSTHRPNRLGQSLVELLDIATSPKPMAAPWAMSGAKTSLTSRTHLLIASHDLVNGTPIVDIKPYLPWADCAPQAQAGLAPLPPATMAVQYCPSAHDFLTARADSDSLAQLITQVLSQDPRPAYRRAETGGRFGVALRDVDVSFCVEDRNGEPVMRVLSITPRSDPSSGDQPPM